MKRDNIATVSASSLTCQVFNVNICNCCAKVDIRTRHLGEGLHNRGGCCRGHDE